MRFLAVNLFLISSLVCSAGFAAPSKPEVKKSLNDEQVNTKKKKIGVDQSDFMPEANNFGVIVSYATSYNSLEQVDRKTYRHRLSFAGTYSFDKNWSSYGAVGVSHESYGDKIVRDNDNDPFHQVSDLNLGVVYTIPKPLSFVSRSSNTLNIALPVSERARVDKHIANLSVTNFMQSYGWKNFSLFNRFSANFLWNTQRFSVYMNDEMNSDWLVSNSLGLTYMILPRVGARFNYRADMVRYLDGSWNLSFGDNLSLFANLSGFQIFASMINNSYEENERIDLGYFDKYRRVFLGGVTYAF